MTDSQLKTARQLYKPSDEVVNMVANICAFLDKKGANGLRFDSTLMLGDLQVEWIEREDSHSALLVHWYPHNSYKFCSAYALKEDELKILYETVMKADK